MPTVGMARAKRVSRVLWPADVTTAPSGYLVGWTGHGFSCCVAAVVPHSAATLKQLQAALGTPAAQLLPQLLPCNTACADSLASDATWARMWAYCSASPTVLGTWTRGDGDPASRLGDDAAGCRQAASLWLGIEQADARTLPLAGLGESPCFIPTAVPSLRSLHCCGCQYSHPCHFVLYSPPDPAGGNYLSSHGHNPLLPK